MEKIKLEPLYEPICEPDYVSEVIRQNNGCHREMCGLCHSVVTVGFHVPDHIWAAVVHPHYINDIHCLTCFTRRADEKLVNWSSEIEFYPVSLVSHLRHEEIRLCGTKPKCDIVGGGDFIVGSDTSCGVSVDVSVPHLSYEGFTKMIGEATANLNIYAIAASMKKLGKRINDKKPEAE